MRTSSKQINFVQLQESHFPLMLEWLEKPHVKKWWDQDLTYTMDLVRKKYGSYVAEYKLVEGEKRSIKAYVICVNEKPVGYIQLYNVYDFPRSKELVGLPSSVGGLDIFIGDENFIGHNFGSQAIKEFITSHCNEFEHLFVDPDINNIAAIKCYEKAGFKKMAEQKDTKEVWMVRNNILEELKGREPIFHHPEKFGKTKQDIENLMCDEFWEVGASGNIYTREDVIKTLVARYNDKNYVDDCVPSDFKLTQIAPDNYLITYNLIQNKIRHTRRSTIWRKIDGSWKILYHQGTVMDGGK